MIFAILSRVLSKENTINNNKVFVFFRFAPVLIEFFFSFFPQLNMFSFTDFCFAFFPRWFVQAASGLKVQNLL